MKFTETTQEGDGKGEPQMTPHDPSRINLDDDHDVVYWSSHFGCTRAQLRAAVEAVGDSEEPVGAQLLKGISERSGDQPPAAIQKS
jgi:hypothetical protein